MESFSTIQQLWISQPIEQAPSEAEMMTTIKQFKARERKTLAWTLLTFLITLVIMALIVTYYHSSMITTRIGEILMTATIFYGIYLKIKTFKTRVPQEALDVSQFLEKLKHDQVKSCTGSSNEQAIGFTGLAIGYFFYVYESIAEDPTTLIIGYSCAVLVLAGMWFLYRPYMIKRRQRKIESLINKLEIIKTKFYEKS